MMKEAYTKPSMDVQEFEKVDILTTSDTETVAPGPIDTIEGGLE